MDNVFDPDLPLDGTYAPNADVLRHIKALRVGLGQPITVLDGKGNRAVCTVQSKNTLFVASYVATKPMTRMVLAMGHLDNKDRMEFAIEKAAELGCTEFVPLMTDHAMHARVSHERMIAKAQAALTQSGQTWLMHIGQTVSLDTFLNTLDSSTHIIVGDPEGSNPLNASFSQNSPVALVVGSEGGLSMREQALLNNLPSRGITLHRWAINKVRLRAETAAVALVSIITSGRT